MHKAFAPRHFLSDRRPVGTPRITRAAPPMEDRAGLSEQTLMIGACSPVAFGAPGVAPRADVPRSGVAA